MPRRMLREDMARLIAYHAIFFDKQGFPFRKICRRPKKSHLRVQVRQMGFTMAFLHREICMLQIVHDLLLLLFSDRNEETNKDQLLRQEICSRFALRHCNHLNCPVDIFLMRSDTNDRRLLLGKHFYHFAYGQQFLPVVIVVNVCVKVCWEYMI